MEKIIKATRPEMPSYEEYITEIESIWDDGSMTNNGPKVQRLRKQLCAYMGCKNADLFVNGHTSSLIALKSLDLPEGGEVLTSPFTFASTTNAIVQVGLVPVFCDIDSTYNIDVDSLRRNITSKTCAIFTPHIFGIPCHVKEIEEIAQEYNLNVIYDGAQAFGTKIKGESIVQYGDITMFSLHAIKIFNAVEGGILTYKDSNLQQKFELYRNFGISYGDTNDVEVAGINAKMTEFSAAMGLVNLPRIDAIISRRKQLAEYYREVFDGISGISIYPYEKGIDYNYAYFPIIIDEDKCGVNRDELWIELGKRNIGTRKLYDRLTCDFSYYRDKPYRKDVRFATEMTKKCLDFPMYSSLTEEDIDYIGEVLREIIK